MRTFAESGTEYLQPAARCSFIEENKKNLLCMCGESLDTTTAHGKRVAGRRCRHKCEVVHKVRVRHRSHVRRQLSFCPMHTHAHFTSDHISLPTQNCKILLPQLITRKSRGIVRCATQLSTGSHVSLERTSPALHKFAPPPHRSASLPVQRAYQITNTCAATAPRSHCSHEATMFL